jgi:fatty acid elongase 3
VFVHNLSLSLISGALFSVLAFKLVEVCFASGFTMLFFDPLHSNARGLLTLCYYINYLLKYVELMDTVLLCLRAKKTPFIHGQ